MPNATCPLMEECQFYKSVRATPLLRIKYATMYPYCNQHKHESCMRWWMMREGKPVPEDLLPDGGRDWFATEARRPHSPESIRVLVVDDMPLFRKVLAGLVQDACDSKASIVEAESAEEALEILREDSEWTLVATDYNMGTKTGYDLIAELRGLPAHSQLPAIVFSSEADSVKRIEVNALPRVRWLAKRPEKEPFIEAWRELVVEHKA